MQKKLQLSNSSKDVYLECPFKYKLYYIDNIRSIDNSSALVFGNALDKALNDLLLKKPDATNIFIQEWDKTASLDISYYKSDLDIKLLSTYCNVDEINDENVKNWLSLKAKGLALLEAYSLEILPKVELLESQKTIMIDMGDFNIKGILDLTGKIDGITYILDNKTTSENYKVEYINKRDQLPLYSYAENIRDVGYLTMNKKTYKCDIVLGKVEESAIQRVLNTFRDVYEKIKQEVFPKNTKSCYSYGRRCPYYNYCHKGIMDKTLFKKVKDSNVG